MLPFTTSDTCQLFQKLEEICIRTSQGSGDDYLGVLTRTTKDGGKAALRRLQTVRLALARYFARCSMIGVGGKHIPDSRLVVDSGPQSAAIFASIMA